MPWTMLFCFSQVLISKAILDAIFSNASFATCKTMGFIKMF